jgi:DNA (cytosine-5)-methyltransferase 1
MQGFVGPVASKAFAPRLLRYRAFCRKNGSRTLAERLRMNHTWQMFESRHIPWDITDERREEYAVSSRLSQLARKQAERRASEAPEANLSIQYDPALDMPQLEPNGLRVLSLFSGGGGLDLGFDRSGFEHVASYDVLGFAGDTIRANRPDWQVHSGINGNVTAIDWRQYRGKVEILHGGPPCQPFSIAGRRQGQLDGRDMFPEFVRAVAEAEPKAFVIENVLGFLSQKFAGYREGILHDLSRHYDLATFVLSAKDFGVPQDRRRAFIVGWRRTKGKRFDPDLIPRSPAQRGVRAALGLPTIDVDGVAPTLRCTLTGPRQTTSIANSTASVGKWAELGIWPHGVSPNRSLAASFPTKDQTYRLCVEECQVLQGFPLGWKFSGAVYQRLGLIGNSVCPPVAYALGKSLFDQLFKE